MLCASAISTRNVRAGRMPYNPALRMFANRGCQLLGGFVMPSAAYLFASILFGTVGFAAFMYGKKSQQWRAMSLGVALMVYPYFIEATWLVYVVGVALCAALYFWRE